MTAFGDALTLPVDDTVGRRAALSFAGEENERDAEKGFWAGAVHALHDRAALEPLAPTEKTTPIRTPTIPERFARGNLAEKALTATAEPLYFDTGPFNIKVKTAGEAMGAKTSGDLQPISHSLTTDQGSAHVVSKLLDSAERDLGPFIRGKPADEQVEILTTYLREGSDHFWELRGLTRQDVETWRQHLDTFRSRSGERPHVDAEGAINRDHLKQVKAIEAATRTSHPGVASSEPAILYLGLNEGAADEAAHLEQASAEHGGVSAITAPVTPQTSARPSRRSEKQFLAQLGIPPDRQSTILARLKGTLARQDAITHPLIERLWQAEQGITPFDRLVISGHSDGSVIWGKWQDGSILEDDLAQLLEAFPHACARVHHVMVAACNNGWKANVAYYRKVFPNLKSYWSYTMLSPSTESGSLAHLALWEHATTGANASPRREIIEGPLAGSAGLPWPMRIREAYDYVRSQFTDAPDFGVAHANNVAIWTADHGYQSNGEQQPGHDAIANSDGYRSVAYSNPRWHAAFDAAWKGTVPLTPSNPELLAYTEALQREIGNDEHLSDWERVDLQQRQVLLLFLRHWASVVEKFGLKYGPQVKDGIARANELDHGARKMPDWDRLSRVEALALSHEMTAARSALPGDERVRVAAELLRALEELDRSKIEESWAA
jgi:hypothetical protein